MNTLYRIEHRKRVEINTDPQRRCYNGCHARSEVVWTEWGAVDFSIPEERVEARLKFWRELNDYAISQRGEGARSEYQAVKITTEETP